MGMHRYDPIRVFECTQWLIPIPIQVLRVMVSQPLISLEQAGRLQNAAHTQWVAHSIGG